MLASASPPASVTLSARARSLVSSARVSWVSIDTIDPIVIRPAQRLLTEERIEHVTGFSSATARCRFLSYRCAASVVAAPAVRFPYGTEPTDFHSLFVGDRQMRKGRSS
jgi:hypothetical protein